MLLLKHNILTLLCLSLNFIHYYHRYVNEILRAFAAVCVQRSSLSATELLFTLSVQRERKKKRHLGAHLPAGAASCPRCMTVN